MPAFLQDLRYGFRRTMRRPTFTVLAVLTLGLGIGAATTIFSVIHNVLLNPAPYADGDRVAVMQILDLSMPGRSPTGRTAFLLPEFLQYREHNKVFEEVMGGGREDILITTAEGTEAVSGGFVTANAFRFLGVPALVGRGLEIRDGEPGAPPVFVMAHAIWQSRYNGDPSLIGRSFVLNGVPSTLVGIMPPRFTKYAAAVWRPVSLAPGDAAPIRRFILQGRLKPGVTLEQAGTDLDAIAHRLATIYPANYPNKFAVRAVRWVDSVVGQFRATLYTLAAAVALLLLIACGNVANMLLASASAREKEMAVRISLGASQPRVVRQLLLESSFLAISGAMLGWLLAYAGIKALIPLIPPGLIPLETVISLNRPVLLFALVLTVLTTLLFGLVPALQTVRRDIVEPLRDSSKGANSSVRRGKLRSTLVIVEIALSLVLLVGAGLLMRTLVALQRVDLGFDPDRVTLARVLLTPGQYDTVAAKQRFFEAVLERLDALPEVVAVTTASSLPPYGGILGEVDIPGQIHSERWDANIELCSEGYFATLGVRLVQGRPFSDVDIKDARKVAVVSQTLVSRYLGGTDPLGQHIKIPMLERLPKGAVTDATFEIIGVVADMKNRGIQDAPVPQVLIPYTMTSAFDRAIMVKTQGAPGAFLTRLPREIWTVDRSAALTLTAPLEDYLQQFSYAAPRFGLILLGVFAAVGLVLVGIGAYSVISYTVSQRTREIGIRMALGAGGGDMLLMVLLMGSRLVVIGIVVGTLSALGATRFIAGQLWGISPHDPSTFAGVVGVVVIAGLLACYLPARRATLVDPIVTLKSE